MTVAGSSVTSTTEVPYASKVGANYFQLYCNTNRNTKKRDHAINHCIAMAQHCYESLRFAEGCDWLIAAAVFAETENELIPRIFDLWNNLGGDEAASWKELFLKPPSQLGLRLIAITLFRILEATNVSFSREVNGRFLEIICEQLPDICGHLQMKNGLPDYEQIGLIKQLSPRLNDLIQPIIEASQSVDLDSVLLRQHRILQALNHKLVAGLLSPHLPSGFTKTTIPSVLKSVEDQTGAEDTRFVEVSERTLAEVNAAIAKLNAAPTFFAREYLFPFLTHLQTLIATRFEASDATKPASVSVRPYPRKYPLHAIGQKCRLRFELHNAGPGPASDVEIEFILWKGVEPLEAQRSVSGLGVGKCLVDVDVVVVDTTAHSSDYVVKCSWRNYDGSQGAFEDIGELGIQNPEVDWEELIASEPYSKEAIQLDSARPFIGRESDLRQLFKTIASNSMGSAYVHGQKRVGKTSLALTAAARAVSEINNFYPIYLEGGDYVQPTAEGTLQAMGRSIARKIGKCSRAFDRIPLPAFTDSLSPLNEYVDEVTDTLSDARFLIILDEFDELPIELYKRGPIGDGLFLTLRALSGRQRLGIILVGGEKMNHIIAAQGDQLNRFESVRVDYFRKEDHWSDFQELVRKPVAEAIDYSDSAVDAVYRWSAGNPFFTNMVCAEILRHCYDRRDAFVSEFEVEEFAHRACSKAGTHSFAHFWEDGILDTGAKVEEVSIQRRKVLLAISQLMRRNDITSKENLARQPDLLSISSVALERELKQFVERGVLVEHNGEYRCRVFMFEQFLRERSAELITTEFTDREERTRQEREENEAYVTSAELLTLTEAWGNFKGNNITPEHVRAWLDQFETNTDKRLMFQLLKAVRFYSEGNVREKLRDAMSFVRRATVELRREGERHRGDILVTHLGGIAKSSAHYARVFCKENKIILRNAVGHDELAAKLQSKEVEVRGVVIVDDLIGTGATAIESLTEFDSAVGKVLRDSGIPIFLIAVCGFQEAIEKVENFLRKLTIQVELHVCDELHESDRAFNAKSRAFSSERDLIRARDLAIAKGQELEKKWPLGYGDSQGLVAFFEACPNNTLPILWKSSKEWRALFPR